MDTKSPNQQALETVVPTTVADFLGLSPAQSGLAETKAAFTVVLKQVRENAGLTQTQLADLLKTTQQAVARAERGATGTSLDFLLKGLLAAGMTLKDVGDVFHEMQRLINIEEDVCDGHALRFPDDPHLERKSYPSEHLITREKQEASQLPSRPVLALVRGEFQEVTASITAKSEDCTCSEKSTCNLKMA